MKKARMKPIGQIMSEMMELPIRFTTLRKIKAQEYYQKIEDISREIKALPEDQRRDALQKRLAEMPEDERKGFAYALTQNGISTKGVSLSDTGIKAKELVNEWDSLSTDDKKAKLKAEIEKDEKFFQYFKKSLAEKGLPQDEIDLKNSSVEENAMTVMARLETMKTKEEKVDYVKNLQKKGILTDSVFKKLMELKENE
jgi:hypothetical protein